MQCQFDAGYLSHVQNKSHSFLFTRHNKRLWSSCTGFKPREQTCFSAAYLGQVTHISPATLVTIHLQVCPLYPVRLIKTVRLRVKKTRKILGELLMLCHQSLLFILRVHRECP